MMHFMWRCLFFGRVLNFDYVLGSVEHNVVKLFWLFWWVFL